MTLATRFASNMALEDGDDFFNLENFWDLDSDV